MTARDDTGPALPPRLQVYAMARELEALGKRAREFASVGPQADLSMALRQLDKARVLLGPAVPES